MLTRVIQVKFTVLGLIYFYFSDVFTDRVITQRGILLLLLIWCDRFLLKCINRLKFVVVNELLLIPEQFIGFAFVSVPVELLPSKEHFLYLLDFIIDKFKIFVQVLQIASNSVCLLGPLILIDSLCQEHGVIKLVECVEELEVFKYILILNHCILLYMCVYL